MSLKDRKRLRDLLSQDAPIQRPARSNAPGGFFRYEQRPSDSAAEKPTKPTFASLLEGAEEETQTEPSAPPGPVLEAIRAEPDQPRPSRRRKRRRRELVTADEVLSFIDSELDREALASASANYVEKGPLFGHQCRLADSAGNEIFIWSSNADDSKGHGALRFYVATEDEADGFALAPESALRLGALLRAVQTQVAVSGEDAFGALVFALLHQQG